MKASASDPLHVGAAAPDRRDAASIRHYQNAEHMANERTHLAYLRTAIALVSLGITMNRFSLYLLQNGQLEPSHPLGLLRGTAQIGLGMVLFGFLVMVVALHRYLRVERAIDSFDYQPQRRLIEGLTLTAVLGGALSIIWMFLR